MAEATSDTRVNSVLNDPSAMAVARVYADAYLDAVPAAEIPQAVTEFGSFADDVYAKSPEFITILNSAMVSRDDKLALLDRVTAGRTSPLFANFLKVLARHDRLDLLPVIYDQTRRRSEIRAGQRRIQVESAIPLSGPLLTQLKQTLAAMLKIDPIIELSVNPELLGGLRVRVGDVIYDSSLRARLNQMQVQLRERSLHEIQSGRNRFSTH